MVLTKVLIRVRMVRQAGFHSDYKQWGTYDETIDGNNYPTITFPLAYKSVCYSVQVTSGNKNESSSGWNYAHTLTPTNFKAVVTAGIATWLSVGR